MLILPDFEKEFVLETDACAYGIGAVLTQERDGQWRPVCFYSKHLTKRERNYSTSVRELLAIVMAVKHFKQMLYGRHFRVITDHQPLKSLLKSDDISPTLLRWLEYLKLFEFTIEYRSGKSHGNADALSRLALVEANAEEDSADAPIIIN